jgi:hypothetical protein
LTPRNGKANVTVTETWRQDFFDPSELHRSSVGARYASLIGSLL